MGMGKFIQSVIGAICTISFARGILLWLGTKSIYPEKWVAGVIGITESGVIAYPWITYVILGISGLVGLFAGPAIYGCGVRLFGSKNEPAQSQTITPIPNMSMPDAIDYVVKILFPDKNPNSSNIDTEEKPVVEEIIKKIKSGDLKTWGKRVEIKQDYGERRFAVNVDQEQFSIEDWKHRELLPLEASIPTGKSPQTRSVGRNDDHIQFTALYVNESQIKDIQWRDESGNTGPSLNISLVELLREAEKQGWRFTDDGSQHIFEFVRALRDAGSTGEIQFWGRKKQRLDCMTEDQSLIRIDADYWADLKIDEISCLEISTSNGNAKGVSSDNFQTRTQDDANLAKHHLYMDIHVDRAQAMNWLSIHKPLVAT